MALTFTQSDLDNLKAALISGAMEVQVGDRRVKYRSQAELLAAIRMIEVAISGGESDSPDVIQATFSKGAK